MTTTRSPIPELTAISEAIDRARSSQPKLLNDLLQYYEWEIYTDGSAPIKNPGGAIGFSAVFTVDEDSAWEIYGGTPGRTSEPATSNNRAEIAGVLAILEFLYQLKQEEQPLPTDVEIVCDSQYVVNCAQGKWKKHKNKDLWRRFDQLMCVVRQNKIKLKFRWTRAHVGTKWNERADVLAKDGAFLAIGKAPSSDTKKEPTAEKPSGLPQDCHYMLTLYSEMKGNGQAVGRYRLATPNRERFQSLEIDDVATLDEAEYLVLRQGLEDLLETLETAGRDSTDFRLLIDSCRDLMLKQLQGIYGVKSERLQPLHLETSSLTQRFDDVCWNKSKKAELKEMLKDW